MIVFVIGVYNFSSTYMVCFHFIQFILTIFSTLEYVFIQFIQSVTLNDQKVLMLMENNIYPLVRSMVFLALICFISLNFTCHIDYFYSYCCIEVRLCLITTQIVVLSPDKWAFPGPRSGRRARTWPGVPHLHKAEHSIYKTLLTLVIQKSSMHQVSTSLATTFPTKLSLNLEAQQKITTGYSNVTAIQTGAPSNQAV